MRGLEPELSKNYQAPTETKPVRWPGADYAKNPVMNKVDSRLVQIIQWTAQSFPLRCTIYSGWRPNSFSHTRGNAIDIVLYDQMVFAFLTINPLPSFASMNCLGRSPSSFK